METENEQVQEDVVVQAEESTSEQTQEETQDVLVLKGEDKAEFEKWKAKKEERRQFAEKAKSQPKQESYVTAEKIERIELRQNGYSSDEVDAIMELGGSKALSNPLVKSAIETMRAKARSEDANQALTSKSPVFKNFTQDDISKMSVKDLEKILPRD